MKYAKRRNCVLLLSVGFGEPCDSFRKLQLRSFNFLTSNIH